MNLATWDKTNGRIERQKRTSRQRERLQARACSYSERREESLTSDHEENVRQQILDDLDSRQGCRRADIDPDPRNGTATKARRLLVLANRRRRGQISSDMKALAIAVFSTSPIVQTYQRFDRCCVLTSRCLSRVASSQSCHALQS
jgi:hypothetical protein